MAKNRTYTDELGKEVVSHLKGGKTAKELAALYLVTEQTIRNWKQRASGHEQRTPIASRRSREIPEKRLDYLRLRRDTLQARLDEVIELIDHYSDSAA